MSYFDKRSQQLSQQSTQQLIFSQQMQQSFHILTLPILELSEWLKDQILCNPALEQEGNSLSENTPIYSSSSSFFEEKEPIDFIKKLSNKEIFFEQIQHLFTQEEELILAKDIIESLDSKGFPQEEEQERLKKNPLYESVIYQIQRVWPFGIGAHSLQESLLIQLECLGKKQTLGYEIVKWHYPLLLKGSVLAIAKALKQTPEAVSLSIQKDLRLLRIGNAFDEEEFTNFLIPDLTISFAEDKFLIEIHEDLLPAFKVSSAFLNKIENAKPETRSYLNHMITSANFIKKSIAKRQETLLKIATFLTKRQKLFLSGESCEVKPLSIKQAAEELELHPSTISRAISEKILYCAHGILPLKTLFSSSICEERKEEDISQSFALIQLKKLIAEEDKSKPLSDQQLLLALRQKGIHCARRTIAKYRNTLSIPCVARRRRFN